MIYLVRQGETDWNLFRRCNGVTETFLNQTGIEQAERQAGNIRDIKFNACFCSPQKRTKDYRSIVFLLFLPSMESNLKEQYASFSVNVHPY